MQKFQETQILGRSFNQKNFMYLILFLILMTFTPIMQGDALANCVMLAGAGLYFYYY